jgi:hypothetical protein
MGRKAPIHAVSAPLAALPTSVYTLAEKEQALTFWCNMYL